MSTATATLDRPRARSAQPAPPTPKTHTAKLIEADQYVLTGGRLGPDIAFKRGEEVSISAEVYAWLAEQTRIVTHREPGRIVQERRRLFLLTDPSGNTLPKTHSEVVRQLDGVDEVDPWAS